MAASVKTCPICQDELKDPRLLPCIHSVCLECLERHCRDQQPGDDVPCPMCSNAFRIPKDGVTGLTIRTHNRDHGSSPICEVCSSEQHNIPATVYCIECSQKLCEKCSRPHLSITSEPREVKALDEVSFNPSRFESYCDKHNERVRIYCYNCQTSACSTCCLESHKTHKFERIDVMAKTSARWIDDEAKQVASRIESFRCAAAQVEQKVTNPLVAYRQWNRK